MDMSTNMAKLFKVDLKDKNAKVIYLKRSRQKKLAVKIFLGIWVIQTIITTYFLIKGYI
jgi:hypothetical protein